MQQGPQPYARQATQQRAQPAQAPPPQPTFPVLPVLGSMMMELSGRTTGWRSQFLANVGIQLQTAERDPLMMSLAGDAIQEVSTTLGTAFGALRSMTMSWVAGINSQLMAIRNLLQAQVTLTNTLVNVGQTQAIMLKGFLEQTAVQQSGFFGYTPTSSLALWYTMTLGQAIAPLAQQTGAVAQGLSLFTTGNVYLAGLARSIATSFATRYIAAPQLMQLAFSGRFGGMTETALQFATRALREVGVASPEEFFGGMYFATQYRYGRIFGTQLGQDIREAIREFREVARELRISTQSAMVGAATLRSYYGLSRPQVFETLRAASIRAIGGTLEDYMQGYQAAAEAFVRMGIGPQYATVFSTLAGLMVPHDATRRAAISRDLAQAALLTGGQYIAQYAPLAFVAGGRPEDRYLDILTRGAGMFGQLGLGAFLTRAAVQYFGNPLALSRTMFSGMDFYTRAIFGTTGPYERMMYLTMMGVPFQSALEVATAYENLPLLNFIQGQREIAHVMGTMGIEVFGPYTGLLGRPARAVTEYLARHPALSALVGGIGALGLSVGQAVGGNLVEVVLSLYALRKGWDFLKRAFVVGEYGKELLERGTIGGMLLGKEGRITQQIRAIESPFRTVRFTPAELETALQMAGKTELTEELLQELRTVTQLERELTREGLRWHFNRQLLRGVRGFMPQLAGPAQRLLEGRIGTALFGGYLGARRVFGKIEPWISEGVSILFRRYATTLAAASIPLAAYPLGVSVAEAINPEFGAYTAPVSQQLLLGLAVQAAPSLLTGQYRFGRAGIAALGLIATPMAVARSENELQALATAISASSIALAAHGGDFARIYARVAEATPRRWYGRLLQRGITRLGPGFWRGLGAAGLAVTAGRALIGGAPGEAGTILDVISGATLGIGQLLMMTGIGAEIGLILSGIGVAAQAINVGWGAFARLTGRYRERIPVEISGLSPMEAAAYLDPTRLRQLAHTTTDIRMRNFYKTLAESAEGKTLTLTSLARIEDIFNDPQFVMLMQGLTKSQTERARERNAKIAGSAIKGIINTYINLEDMDEEEKMTVGMMLYNRVASITDHKTARQVLITSGFEPLAGKIEKARGQLYQMLLSRLKESRDLTYKDVSVIAKTLGISPAYVLGEAIKLGFKPKMRATEIGQISPDFFSTEEGRKLLQEKISSIAEIVYKETGAKRPERVTTETLMELTQAAIAARKERGESTQELERALEELKTLTALSGMQEINLVQGDFESMTVQLATQVRRIVELLDKMYEKIR